MSSTKGRIIFLIASGQTDWQRHRRLQGATDLPLSPDGAAQITAAAATMPAGMPPSVIFTSPDEASCQTADRFGADIDARIKIRRDLSEMDLGLWQGLTEEDLNHRYRRKFRQWLIDPASVAPPDGESLEEATDRLRAALAKIVSRYNAPIALVLRPIMLAIATAALTHRPIADVFTEGPCPPVQRFELDENVVNAVRRLRRRKLPV